MTENLRCEISVLGNNGGKLSTSFRAAKAADCRASAIATAALNPDILAATSNLEDLSTGLPLPEHTVTAVRHPDVAGAAITTGPEGLNQVDMRHHIGIKIDPRTPIIKVSAPPPKP